MKIPKAISHTQRLVGVTELLDAFVDQIAGLGEKLAVVLLQLPPSFAFDHAIAADFLNELRRRLPEAMGVACEPRHASWFSAEADGCLVEHCTARVVADPVLVAGGEQPSGWPGLRYFRLHGAPRVYYSSYGEPQLQALGQTLSERSGADNWCIFDNTASGAATGNALALQAILAGCTERG